MSRDLEQLLHDTAAQPSDVPDPAELVARGRRRRLRRHTGGIVAGTAAALLAGVVVLQAVPTGPGPEILDQPPGTQQPATGSSADDVGQPTTDRTEMTEPERQRLQARIAKVEEQIAELEAQRGEAVAQHEEAIAEGADQRTLMRLGIIRNLIEIRVPVLEAELRTLQAQLHRPSDCPEVAPSVLPSGADPGEPTRFRTDGGMGLAWGTGDDQVILVENEVAWAATGGWEEFLTGHFESVTGPEGTERVVVRVGDGDATDIQIRFREGGCDYLLFTTLAYSQALEYATLF